MASSWASIQDSSVPRSRFPRTDPPLLMWAEKARLAACICDLLNQVEAMEVSGSEGAAVPFFSPDGHWVGFASDGKLRKASWLGGPTVDLCDVGQILVGATWSRDSTILFASDAWPTAMRVPASGGVPQPVSTNGLQAQWPSVLPGNEAFVFEGVESELVRNTYVQLVDGGEPRLLIEDAVRPVYVESGHLLFQRNEALMAVAFDPRRLRVVGSPIPVVERLRSKHYSVSSDGNLVYVPDDPVSEEKRPPELFPGRPPLRRLHLPGRLGSRPREEHVGQAHFLRIQSRSNLVAGWPPDLLLRDSRRRRRASFQALGWERRAPSFRRAVLRFCSTSHRDSSWSSTFPWTANVS